MFEHLAKHKTIIVTGPHRSGTTIAAEIIAADTGKRCVREEAFNCRDIIKAEKIIKQGGVIQGPYLLPWVNLWPDAFIVYMERDKASIDASLRVLQKKRISLPFFSKDQAERLLMTLREDIFILNYESLSSHPKWRDGRLGWGHRQTA